MKIKICGLRRPEDIEYINEVIPDFIGFILASGYKRTVTIEEAKKLAEKLNPYTETVGVFVNQPVDFVKKAVDEIGLSVYQLHGDEDINYIKKARDVIDADVWKAVRARSISDIEKADRLGVDALVIDSFSKNAYGGTGKIANWDLIKRANIKSTFFLAGGIDINNIKEALNISENIDISSGVETDGFKDCKKIIELIGSVRNG